MLCCWKGKVSFRSAKQFGTRGHLWSHSALSTKGWSFLKSKVQSLNLAKYTSLVSCKDTILDKYPKKDGRKIGGKFKLAKLHHRMFQEIKVFKNSKMNYDEILIFQLWIISLTCTAFTILLLMAQFWGIFR